MAALKDVQDSSLELSKILDNRSIFILIKKTERLTSALYLILSLNDVHDPLTKRLRGEGVELLSLITDFCQEGDARAAEKLKLRVARLTSLIEVARFSGLISEMNASVLVAKYAELYRAGERVRTELHGKNIGVESILSDTSDILEGETKKNKRQNLREFKAENKKTAFHKGQAKGQKRKHSDRRETIMNLIRSKGRITVKDAAHVIRGPSEKTLQRELVSLVSEGVLKREGERRWSSYVLP